MTPIRAYTDNYIWFLYCDDGTAVVDPGDALPVETHLHEQSLDLKYILLTHHHRDHIGGVSRLQTLYPQVKIFGPEHIKGVNHPVVEGNEVILGSDVFQVWHVPGHTLDHLCYVHPNHVFCGDTLFSGGVGRLFEGSMEQLFAAIQRMNQALPEEACIYPAHEYTRKNLEFALSVLGQDDAIVQRRNVSPEGALTLPTSLIQERQINVFLRCHEEKVQKALGIHCGNGLESAWDAFSRLRSLRDQY